ncbi:DMT family transporter [Chloroflexota bacterium]
MLAYTTLVGLFGLGIFTGALIAVQSVLNSSLGARIGLLGSALVLTIISMGLLLVFIVFFPRTANLRALPSFSEWYLYFGGILGVVIIASPIFLVPKLGAATTLTALVVGQLTAGVIIDHFGLISAPKIEAGLLRVAGVVLITLGAIFISK